jgi:hypothetical protein
MTAIITLLSILGLILIVALWQWIALVGLVILVGAVGYGVLHARMRWEMHQVTHRREHLANIHSHEKHRASMDMKRGMSSRPEPYDTHSEVKDELDRALEYFAAKSDPEEEVNTIRELHEKGLTPAAIAGKITGKRGGAEYQEAKIRVLEVIG